MDFIIGSRYNGYIKIKEENLVKKLLVVLLSMLMVVTLFGCSKPAEDETQPSDEPKVTEIDELLPPLLEGAELIVTVFGNLLLVP